MDVEQRAHEIRDKFCPPGDYDYSDILDAIIAALTPPEDSDQSLLELAATFETCIPFLPSAGQKNIGKAVAQLRQMAMGYVLVPVEPTEKMQRAGAGITCTNVDEAWEVWHAMVAARPEVKP